MKTTRIAALALGLALLVPGGMANAADGGKVLEDNPGVAALYDGNGKFVCSATMVSPQWALTWDGSLPCTGAQTAVIAGSHEATEPIAIDGEVSTDQGPSKSQAKLIHLASPVSEKDVLPRADRTPAEGEDVELLAFDGTGKHLTSTPLKVEGSREWLSWYTSPEGTATETGKDTGAAIVKDGQVLGFVGLAGTGTGGFDAEAVAPLNAWINEVIAGK